MGSCISRLDKAAAHVVDWNVEREVPADGSSFNTTLLKFDRPLKKATERINGARSAVSPTAQAPSVLAQQVDSNAHCEGHGLNADEERMMLEAILTRAPAVHDASTAPPPRDHRPASPIRSQHANAFFDRYLDTEQQAWNRDMERDLACASRRANEVPVLAQDMTPRVVHVTPQIAERLKLAKCSIDLARALLSHGPSNQVRNLSINGLETSVRLRSMRTESNYLHMLDAARCNPMESTRLEATCSIRWEAGNCDEYAAVTMSILCQLPELRDVAIDVIGNSLVGHTLVVIRDPDPLNDIVVDAWSVMPVPCLKVDAADAMGLMAQRPEASSSNCVHARK